ncbi:hypothetical protein DL764_005751 [Monosporascus ibericus]|uniref:Methyltransferase type 11 domain-containing protein n=1 Tax=Monosporascus ibericus TaxID=155417 RepID=A0A4Q4TBB3_9PEZI|nr:hypothetical protein DL764_005751 [Monosporascus ibericus]
MAENTTQIEADVVADDHDSVLDDELSTFTTSLTSSVVNYPVEHGRRYHAFRSGVYCLPNDEVCTNYAILKILANDLSAVQPTWCAPRQLLPGSPGLGELTWHVRVPPNVKFEIDDMESPWLYNIPFDFIFCRYMTACIKDWPKLVRNIFENLTSGGWAEFQDFDLQYYSEDGSLTESHDTTKWINLLIGAARKIGRDPCPGVSLEKWVKEAGFKNVTHHRFRFPVGPWPRDPDMKEIGMYNLTQVLQGLEGFSLRLFCDVLGWRQEEVVVLTSKVRKELKSRHIHAQFDL